MQTDTCSSGPIYPMDLFILTNPMSTATELSMVVPWPLFTLWPQALFCHAALIVVKGEKMCMMTICTDIPQCPLGSASSTLTYRWIRLAPKFSRPESIVLLFASFLISLLDLILSLAPASPRTCLREHSK